MSRCFLYTTQGSSQSLRRLTDPWPWAVSLSPACSYYGQRRGHLPMVFILMPHPPQTSCLPSELEQAFPRLHAIYSPTHWLPDIWSLLPDSDSPCSSAFCSGRLICMDTIKGILVPLPSFGVQPMRIPGRRTEGVRKWGPAIPVSLLWPGVPLPDSCCPSPSTQLAPASRCCNNHSWAS